MAGVARRTTAVIGLTAAVLAIAACSASVSPQAKGAAAVRMLPQRILRAPKSLIAAAEPQPDGLMWALAGSASTGLFEMNSSTGQMKGSFSVSGSARGVAESSTGVIGLALGTPQTGALELLSARSRKLITTVPLPAPARQIVVGSDGQTFYVLTSTSTAASVTIVGSSGQVHATVPMPSDAVSVVPDTRQATLYALERTGLVDQISVSTRKVVAKFKVGDAGSSIALSPDDSTLYVLKNAGAASNIAVVSTDTEAVRQVLPAPRNCAEVLVSPGGGQLYEVVGTAGYGNIQVFAI